MPAERYRWTPGDFVAGQLSLEFTNTVGDLGKTRDVDRLSDWQAYLEWAVAAGVLAAGEAQSLGRPVVRQSAQCRNAFSTALAFRAALYRAMSAIAAGRAPLAVDFDLIETEIVEAVASAHLRPVEGAYVWTATAAEIAPTTPLSRIVLSTLQLLQGPELPSLRECQRCSWLFIDRSKNHARRWCRADACGNRARVERHYRSHST